ncbi:MAG: DNA polymerase III [Candidatus Liptonbacteria bacterium RIFCSPLOWO2_01_FULL_53_13]|uniref:DNA polymerase beta n=1 Tax=Candidatus Liptonbacteria bacterium RIFCSPLOWO2_01_FULL_53_13 TaxID=1798651 RepID=A0A1G2CNB7_9BACT|nr:MAG: DNA polymerase III [Candidatus Liptonbacteria bacterium RIFCSPLOWO2_01_FULL_53_13]
MKSFSNAEISEKLSQIAEYLEMQEVPFKPRAYQKVAETIQALAEPVHALFAKGGVKALEEIPGVGKGIAEKIEELFKTGKISELEKLKKKTPVDLASLTKIQGVGPKSIRTLYQKLGVKTVADLEKAAVQGRVRGLEGFGVKSEENILKGVSFAKKSAGRFPLGDALPLARAIEERLRARKDVVRAVAAGSLRRRKETIGDIDILVISEHPEAVMDFVAGMPEVARVYGKGGTKTSVRLSSGLNLDVRVVPEGSYGAALMYFTGSKDHNVALRSLAMKKGYKLNEYGLFLLDADVRGYGKGEYARKEKRAAGTTEREIYQKLGMDYIEPELRENTGEIDAAIHHKLPNLIEYGSLKGDLQVQTKWSDGDASIEEMAIAAMRAGLSYMAVTDHTKYLTVAMGLNEAQVAAQGKEIDSVNKKLQVKGYKFRVLKGTECDIKKDGSLDLADSTLAKLDVVGISVHSYFKMTRAEQTARIIRAMENPHADILFHPTGRIVGRREPYEVDMEQIIKAAKRTGTILEIDALERLDLKDEYIKMAVKAGLPRQSRAEAGVKMTIDSDAHATEHFGALEYGIAQARRGWASKKDIVNTFSVQEMLKMFKK